MRNVLNSNRNVILNVFDKRDGRQAARSKLFDKWFRIYSCEKVIKHDGKLIYHNLLETELVLLKVNTENPYSETIVEAFCFIIESEK
jgi:hypothetical protein